MKRIFVNFLYFADKPWYFHYITNHLKIFHEIEMLHDSNSNTIFIPLEFAVRTEISFNANKVIISDLYNYDDQTNDDWINVVKKFIDKDITCLTNNRRLHNILVDQKIIVYDLLFNRTKFYYFNSINAFENRNKLWYYVWDGPNSVYNLNKILDKNIKKHFVSLTRRMLPIRQVFVDHLINNHSNKGYIGCVEKNKYIPGDILQTGEEELFRNVPGYRPIPNEIYNETFASIYTESTFVKSNILHVTEKTFEPLLKGNFIIPYSNPNFIEGLKNDYNFKFPNNIDYSYDTESNYYTRFEKFLNSIDKFCNLSIDELMLEVFNKDIIEHNRQVFVDKPYDTSIEQLL